MTLKEVIMRSPMKRRLLMLLSSVVLSGILTGQKALAVAQPGQPGDFGLGAMFGAPTGLSVKYWVGNTTALDGGMAWHFGDDARFQIHADHLWHINVPSMNVPNGRLPVYVGAGLRVLAGDHPEAGIRIPVGLSYLVANAPVEVFAEIVPIVEFAPDSSGELDGAVGVRYYFKTH
jgi:hypothetical protein